MCSWTHFPIGRALTWTLVVVLAVCPFTLVADEPTTKEKLAMIRKHIAKQQRNIQRMKDELKRNPENPDSRKLNDFFATATGQRTEAYEGESEYIQDLIDEFEGNWSRNIGHSVALATGAGGSRIRFMVEIDRSGQFIQQLRGEETKLLEDLKDDPGHKVAGLWTWGSGGVFEILEDEDGINCIIRKVPAQFRGWRGREVGSYFFYAGKKTGPNSFTALWNSAVKMSVCPKLRNSKPIKMQVTLAPSGNVLIIKTKKQSYNKKTCKWTSRYSNVNAKLMRRTGG